MNNIGEMQTEDNLLFADINSHIVKKYKLKKKFCNKTNIMNILNYDFELDKVTRNEAINKMHYLDYKEEDDDLDTEGCNGYVWKNPPRLTYHMIFDKYFILIGCQYMYGIGYSIEEQKMYDITTGKKAKNNGIIKKIDELIKTITKKKEKYIKE